MSLRRWLILLLGGIWVALVGSWGGVYFLAWQKAKEIESQALTDYTQAVARQMQARLQDLTAWVERLAQHQGLVNAATLSEVATAEEQLKQLIPAAVYVKLLPKEMERWSELGLGFADLDLIRQAEIGHPPPAVHGFGSPKARVAIAQAIKPSDRVLGILLVGIDLAWLRSAVPTPSRGAIALYQGSLQLVYRGDDGLQNLPPTGTVSIPGTLWQLKYWASVPDWTNGLGSAAILAIALLSISGMVWWLWRRCAWAIEQDCRTLFTRVSGLLAGTVGGNDALMLRELQPLLDQLLQVQPALRPVEESAKAQEELPEVKPEAVSVKQAVASPKAMATVSVPEEIFQEETIGGSAGDVLTPALAYELGRAIGSEAGALGEQRLVVGRDARHFSPELAKFLIDGLRASGRDVIDLGQVPTPLVEFATYYLPVRSAVMVTGSYRPPPYCGLKIVIDQQLWWGEPLKALQRRLRVGELANGLGMLESRDLVADYIGAVLEDVQIARPLKVIVDCGAGVATQVLSPLLRALGCNVEESHSREMVDPFASGALDRLSAKVRQDPEAELGLACDGDGCRLAVVDSAGNLILPDRVLMLLAADVLSRAPGGDIVFDVECSRQLASYILQHGGRPVMAPSGEGHLRARMDEVKAVLGGGNGYILFRERWFGFADAMYGAARLAEVLASEPAASEEVFASLPQLGATAWFEVDLAREEAARIMRVLLASADKFFEGAKITSMGGVRVDFAESWGLVRAAGEALRFRFEADDKERLARICARFREWFQVLEIDLALPFDVRGE